MHNEIINLDENKQIKISAILFEANLDEMKERGVNWDFILSKTEWKELGNIILFLKMIIIFNFVLLQIYISFPVILRQYLDFGIRTFRQYSFKMSVVVNDMEKAECRLVLIFQ